MNASTVPAISSSPPAAGSMAAVAPKVSADSRRASAMSETITSVAPNARATCAVTTPIGPAPAMSTRSPGWISALRAVAMATESGSMRAAASSLTLSGIAKAKWLWIVTYSWKAPSVPGTA